MSSEEVLLDAEENEDVEEELDLVNPNKSGLSSLLQNLNENRKNEIVALLRSLNTQFEAESIFDSPLVYKCFFKLNNLTIRTSPSNDELRLFGKFKFEKLIAKMLAYYKGICLELDFSAIDANNNTASTNIEFNEDADLNKRRISIFSNMLFILNQLLFKLVDFTMEFLREPEAGLTSLLELATNEQIFQLLNENDLKLLSALVNSLKSLSMFHAYNEDIRRCWIDSKAAVRFIVVAHSLKTFKITRQIYMILAQISDEDTIQSLPEINQVIKSLCSDMNSFCNLFKTSPSINRIQIELMNKWLLIEDPSRPPVDNSDEVREYDITFLNGKSLIHVLNDLNKLAADPILKNRIWEAHYAKNSLKYIILNGNEIEKLYALKLFYNLCRIEQVVEFLYMDAVLKNSIVMLSKNKKIQIGEIRHVSRKINELTRKQELPMAQYLLAATYFVGILLGKLVFRVEDHF